MLWIGILSGSSSSSGRETPWQMAGVLRGLCLVVLSGNSEVLPSSIALGLQYAFSDVFLQAYYSPANPWVPGGWAALCCIILLISLPKLLPAAGRDPRLQGILMAVISALLFTSIDCIFRVVLTPTQIPVVDLLRAYIVLLICYGLHLMSNDVPEAGSLPQDPPRRSVPPAGGATELHVGVIIQAYANNSLARRLATMLLLHYMPPLHAAALLVAMVLWFIHGPKKLSTGVLMARDVVVLTASHVLFQWASMSMFQERELAAGGGDVNILLLCLCVLTAVVFRGDD